MLFPPQTLTGKTYSASFILFQPFRGETMIRRTLAFVLLAVSFSLAQAKRPFTFEVMMQLKRIGDFAVSPDGKWVTFSAVDVSLADNTRKSHLWIVPLAGGPERRLTPAGADTEDRLRFSPDGKWVLYTAMRKGASQIYLQPFDPETGALTGQPRPATSLSTEADGGVWSPDGKQILFVSAVYPECRDDACNKAKDDELDKSKVKAQVFTRLMYRHWNAYANGKRSHLFLAPVDCTGRQVIEQGGQTVYATASAEIPCPARDLTPGDHDVPPFSLGGQDQYQFSPDGKEIAFTSNIDEVEATSTNSDVFTLSLADPNAKPVNLTAANQGNDSTPMYSPDGKWIAIRSQFRAGYESDRFRLQLIDRATKKITNLTENFDRWVESMAWAPDSKTIYLTAGNKGDAPLYELAISGGEPRLILRGTNDSPTPILEGKKIIVLQNSVKFPNELLSVAASHNDLPAGPGEDISLHQTDVSLSQLTHLNDAVLSQVQMQPVEPFWFTGSESAKVEGFILKPPNFDPARKYPVKFLIHGGPQGAWGDDWSFRWNPNLFAANGYVVIMINPRGSTGYGQKFVDDVNSDWGGRPFQDLMLGLDYAETHFPYLDKNRECALGGSYGGYMANWILGHSTRFRCIVSHDGMFNSESAWGTTEELWFNEWEYKGTPWTNRELYRKSPMLAAPNFKTPTLVIHGQLDYRLDVGEGFQLFTTLQRLKVPSKMLYFPDEGHWVLKPQNSQLWYKTVNDWVDLWTKPNPSQ
jgi:dipeptidyl aminopeptidase/acylaminoacyl peptidase